MQMNNKNFDLTLVGNNNCSYKFNLKYLLVNTYQLLSHMYLKKKHAKNVQCVVVNRFFSVLTI